jgi:hypothetical protein
MKQYIAVIAITTALALTASAAHTASKHKRYPRHPRGSAVVAPAPSSSVGPATRMVPPDPYRCYQDEGYGRWTICGQGR